MIEEKKSINESSENSDARDDGGKSEGLTQTLTFGLEEKILSKEEQEKLIWWTFWIEDCWSTQYYKVMWVSSRKNSLDIKNEEPEWPSISCDQTELADILREWWYTLIKEWRSGFASRNSYIITGKEIKEKKSAPLIIMGTDIVWTGKIYEREILAGSEVQIAKDALEEAKKQLKNRRHKKMKAYIEESKKGDISIISVWWWPEDFSFGEIPENYEIISEKRTACTQDYRRNISHTYEVILIDKAIFQGKWFVKIQVPDEYKGIVIGKWWSKIRGLSEKFTCTISIR